MGFCPLLQNIARGVAEAVSTQEQITDAALRGLETTSRVTWIDENYAVVFS